MPLTLRHLTGRKVAYSVWELPTGDIVFVKNTHRQFDTFARINGGAGEIAGKPDPDARCIKAANMGELDTLDGYPSRGDCWEYSSEDRDGNPITLLAVAGDWHPNLNYSYHTYGVPANNLRRVQGVEIKVDGCRETLRNYNLADLGVMNPSRQESVQRVAVDRQIPAHNSVEIDAIASDGIDGVDATDTVTIASFTVANNSDRHMAVLLGCRSGQTISDITFNASSLTSRADANSGSMRVSAWDTVAPAVTTANVVVTFSANASATVGVFSTYNVDQTTPRSALETSPITFNATPTDTIASATGQKVIAHVGWHSFNSDTLTFDATWTQSYNNAFTGSNDRSGAGGYEDGATSVTFTGTLSGNTDWMMVMVALTEAAAGAEVSGGEQLTQDWFQTRRLRVVSY